MKDSDTAFAAKMTKYSAKPGGEERNAVYIANAILFPSSWKNIREYREGERER